MTPSLRPRRVDVFEAVKYDICLHGFRFIAAEFALVGIGALALSVVELLHAGHGGSPLVGGVWFLAFALNCLAVVILALCVRRGGTQTKFGDRRLHLYALELVVLLLILLAVAVVAAYQWQAGDLRPSTSIATTQEIA